MITNIPNLGMNYLNYKTSIVQKYHVQLLGWPSDIPFVNPHQLTTIAAARSLQNSLTVSTCKWVVMSKRQQNEHTVIMAADVERGRAVGRKRKVRSDKGKKRGKQPADDNDEDDDSERDEQQEEANDNSDENDSERPTPAKKQKSSASRRKKRLHTRKADAATSSSRSKASTAKKAKSIAKKLPPVASKSKEFIDTEEDDSDN